MDGQTGVAHYAFTHSRILAINPVQNLCPPSSTVYVHLLKHNAIKTCGWGGGEGTAPRTFNLSTRWWRVVIFTLRPFCCRGKRSLYALNMGLGRQRTQADNKSEREMNCTCWEANPDHVRSIHYTD